MRRVAHFEFAYGAQDLGELLDCIYSQIGHATVCLNPPAPKLEPKGPLLSYLQRFGEGLFSHHSEVRSQPHHLQEIVDTVGATLLLVCSSYDHQLSLQLRLGFLEGLQGEYGRDKRPLVVGCASTVDSAILKRGLEGWKSPSIPSRDGVGMADYRENGSVFFADAAGYVGPTL